MDETNDGPLLPWRHLLVGIVLGLTLAAIVIGVLDGFQM